jgi:hypothetical protein
MREDAEEPSRTGNSKGAEGMSEKEIDANLEGTFPASDPPSWTLGTEHQRETSISTTDETEQKKST